MSSKYAPPRHTVSVLTGVSIYRVEPSKKRYAPAMPRRTVSITIKAEPDPLEQAQLWDLYNQGFSVKEMRGRITGRVLVGKNARRAADSEVRSFIVQAIAAGKVEGMVSKEAHKRKRSLRLMRHARRKGHPKASPPKTKAPSATGWHVPLLEKLIEEGPWAGSTRGTSWIEDGTRGTSWVLTGVQLYVYFQGILKGENPVQHWTSHHPAKAAKASELLLGVGLIRTHPFKKIFVVPDKPPHPRRLREAAAERRRGSDPRSIREVTHAELRSYHQALPLHDGKRAILVWHRWPNMKSPIKAIPVVASGISIPIVTLIWKYPDGTSQPAGSNTRIDRWEWAERQVRDEDVPELWDRRRKRAATPGKSEKLQKLGEGGPILAAGRGWTLDLDEIHAYYYAFESLRHHPANCRWGDCYDLCRKWPPGRSWETCKSRWPKAKTARAKKLLRDAKLIQFNRSARAWETVHPPGDL